MAEAIREHSKFTNAGPRVIDVALELGFASESGLRAAKKRFQESPQVAQAWAALVPTDSRRDIRSGSPA